MTGGGRYKPRRALKLACHVCGEEFEATRPDARYCSSRCRQQLTRAMKLVRSVKQNLFKNSGGKK